MPLNKPNQQLRRDLKDAAALLKWSGVDLFQAAQKLSDRGLEAEALELISISLRFQEAENKLTGYADEVRDGRIVRERAE